MVDRMSFEETDSVSTLGGAGNWKIQDTGDMPQLQA